IGQATGGLRPQGSIAIPSSGFYGASAREAGRRRGAASSQLLLRGMRDGTPRQSDLGRQGGAARRPPREIGREPDRDHQQPRRGGYPTPMSNELARERRPAPRRRMTERSH